ncbi:hypothetical protein L4D20_02405 [Vibrio kyushuensis]|uniref:hypothetical protein n=1 Tax=Vibrio TaxID=662 RepID=UPI003D0DEECF
MEQFGSDSSMAISVYLATLVITSILYPFMVAGISLTFYDKENQRPYIVRFSAIWLVITLTLIVLHIYSRFT